jgi:hypothetical protein
VPVFCTDSVGATKISVACVTVSKVLLEATTAKQGAIAATKAASRRSGAMVAKHSQRQ